MLPFVTIPRATITSELVGKTFTVTRLGASSLRAPPSVRGRASPIPQTDKWHWHLEGGVHSKWIIVKGPLWGRKAYALLRQVRGSGDGWPACCPPWNAVFNLTQIV